SSRRKRALEAARSPPPKFPRRELRSAVALPPSSAGFAATLRQSSVASPTAASSSTCAPSHRPRTPTWRRPSRRPSSDGEGGRPAGGVSRLRRDDPPTYGLTAPPQ